MIVDRIVEELANSHINTYFIVTGGAIVPFVDAVGRSRRTKYYCFQHEQSAAMAAEGFYRASGKVGVVLVTSGPGVQNILNGVCGCWYDSIPTLFISGQVNFNESLDSVQSHPRQVGFQEFPVEGTFQSCTKYSKKIQNASEISNVFSTAVSTMLSGRCGPVIIDFPVNFQMTPATDDFKINCVISPLPKDSHDISHVFEAAVRPLVVLGNGIRGNVHAVQTWLEKTNVPFVTSWGAYDAIDNTHPLRLGNIGVYGDRVANMALQNADVLLILGSRMDTRQTGGNLGTCSKTSIKIMVDIDMEEIKKLNERGFHIDYPIHSDVQAFLSSFPARQHNTDPWMTILGEWKSTLDSESMRVPGDVYDILKSIELPDECIVIPDCGGNLVWAMQSLKLTKKQRLFSNFGNSSMGYALPASIGASIGTDGSIPIVCICGDGGIQMNIQELHTLCALNLPVTILIINNCGYGIIRQFQDQYFGSRYTATSYSEVFGDGGIDIVKIANAYGIDAVATTQNIAIHTKPFLYDIQINPGQKIYPKLEFGNSLENMSPIHPAVSTMMIAPYTQPNVGTGWVCK
jgi:acetolactate synthase-1/2/3 large subunit